MALEGKSFSHYCILQLIGRGGMGEVYLVEDTQVQRQVAAKIIRIETAQPGQDSTSNALRLFWREATAIARLDHPHILPLYDHGEATLDGWSFAYLIMPYRPDGSLINWLRTRGQAQQTRDLRPKQVAHIVQQAGEALQYAHDNHVMHLDVKPSNFLVRRRSNAEDYPDLLLCDFGISRLASATSSFSQNASGTPTYMAPEQWASRPAFASDQYALAIMAYELLTGSPPFQGTPMSVMYAHAHEQPIPVCERNPQLPPSVDRVLQRALAKKPEERFPTVAQFAQHFQEALHEMDAATTLRVLPASSTPPTPQAQNTPSTTGDLRVTLAISKEEARDGTTRTLTLANGRTVSIQVPPGVHNGQVLILVGQGDQPEASKPAGNLYLTLSILESAASTPTALPEATATTRTPSLAPTSAALPILAATQAASPPHAPRTDPQSVSLPQSPATPPPTPAKRKRRRSPAFFGALFLLIILFFGGVGTVIYGATTGNWPWHAHMHYSINSVTWSGSQYVAVGKNNTILTSSDGQNWTSRTTTSSLDLYSVIWSGSQFVAVGYLTVLTSPDGQNWTAQDIPNDLSYLYSVTWSKSQYVAVGENTILTSPNGYTWTSQAVDSLSSLHLYSVTWSGSQFVAVGENSSGSTVVSSVLTSPDGRIWTAQTVGGSSAPSALSGVIWSGTQFVAVGDTIITSPDGYTWTSQASSTSQYLYGVTWSKSQYVAVGNSGTILTSPDGKTWTSQASGTSEDLNSITWSGSQFVAVGGKGIILTSPDGRAWTSQSSSTYLGAIFGG